MAKKRSGKKATPTVTLPTKLSVPSSEIEDYITMIFGLEKIGKTTLLSRFDDVFHAMFEEGGRALALHQRSIRSWSEWLQYLKLLEKDDTFGNVSLDTIDEAFEMCFDYVCRVEGFSHPADAEYGKGWDAMYREFHRSIRRLTKVGKGIFFVSHARERTIKSRHGGEYDRIVPSMKNQARKVIEPLVDIWAYYYYDGDERWLQIVGDDLVAAGHRLEGRFLDKNTGEPLKAIPMGNSADEAYRNLTSAFNNELALKGGGTKRAKKKVSRKKTKRRKS